MLDRKNFTYPALNKTLLVKYKNSPVISDLYDKYNLYYVSVSKTLTIVRNSQTILTAIIFQLLADIYT